MKRSLLCAAAFGLCAANAFATPATISPTDDSFVYKFLGMFNFSTGDFASILTSAGDPDHQTRSYVHFDLTGQSIAAGEKAMLNLYVRDGAGLGLPFGNPSTSFPAPTDVYGASSTWSESTLTWNNQPGFTGSPAASKNIDGVGQHVSFDITSLVQSWIANPSTNFGVAIDQSVVVTTPTGEVATVYDSSSATNAPFLQILAVPEPGFAGLVSIGVLILRRRRSA
jgi:hypothetical protein